MKKILIFTTTEGHLSIAQAVNEILRKNRYQVKTVDLISENIISKSYIPLYRNFPSFLQLIYQLSKKPRIEKGVKTIFQKSLEKKVKKELKDSNPDSVIVTHPFYLPTLESILDYQKTPIPFLNIITNPLTIHPLEFSSLADFNFVYDKSHKKMGKRNKIPQEKIFPLGWLIRKNFYQKYNRALLRKNLGFKKNILTFLICGGSEGTNMILKIIPALFLAKKPLQVIVVCGSNKALYKTLVSLKKITPKLKKIFPLNLKLYQFTHQLPQLMTVSDLVIGKAGPNLIFETVAQKRPFFAICHIAGQEDGNLDLIREKGLGLVEENPFKALKLLQKIINHSQFLEKFKPALQKERSYNLQAEKKLIKLVKRLL